MTADGGRLGRRAREVILDWVLRYTDGVEPRLARDRFDEIVSDLWEQQAAARRSGASDLRSAVGLLLRAARGVPADLGWRRAHRAVPAARAHRAPARWIPLGDGALFDQTNGTAGVQAVGPERRDRDTAVELLEKGAASNIVNVGFGPSF